MKKGFRLFTLAAVLVSPLLGIGLVASAQKAKGSGSAGTGLVSDSSPNLVRSDGGGLYDDGVNCVSVIAGFGGGFYQIRTVHNSDPCNGEPSWWNKVSGGTCSSLTTPPAGAHRYLKLEFSSPVAPTTTTTTPGDLDGNGAAATVECAPARFGAGGAFAQGATTTPVGILILKVSTTNGSTTQDTAWQLQYRNEATVFVHADGSRDIFLGQAGALAATADLCEVVQVVNPNNGRVTTKCDFRGTFDMPFFVTAAKK